MTWKQARSDNERWPGGMHSIRHNEWHDAMFVQSTSGATGLPKFSIATHLQFYFRLASLCEYLPSSRPHRYVATMPLFLAMGRNVCLLHLPHGSTTIGEVGAGPRQRNRPVSPDATGLFSSSTISISASTKGQPALSAHFGNGWHYPGELAAFNEFGYVYLRGRTSVCMKRRAISAARIFAVI